MDYLVRMRFGSHVYGTNVATSDTDIKAIYLPNGDDILLQRVKPTIVTSTKLDSAAKNGPQDVDTETFSLQQYLKLLMEGQTVALDMLFTPGKFHYEWPSVTWGVIYTHREKFLHSGVTSYAGYCKTQAAKYGIKGSRLAAVRQTLDFLKTLEPSRRLADYADQVRQFAYPGDLYDSHNMPEPLIRLSVGFDSSRKLMMEFLEVCGRKVSFSSTVKHASQIFQKVFDQYGQRALAAEKNEGIDWKALMHAVRVIEQAKELLSTGHITFPRPEAPLLLDIRQGKLLYAEVAEKIEQGIVDMNAASQASKLPKEPDRAFAEELVLNAYRQRVRP